MTAVVLASMLLAVAIVGALTGRGDPRLLWLALAFAALSRLHELRQK